MAAKKKPSLIDIQAELQEESKPVVPVKADPFDRLRASPFDTCAEHSRSRLRARSQAVVLTEGERLAELEQVIDTNLRAFYDVGYALKEIKETQLYKTLGYNTFEEYCAQRWDMHRTYAYRLIDSSNVVANLSPIGDILPERESQVRPLARLSPDQQRAVWQKIVDSVTAHEQAKITAKLVEDTVAEVTGQTKIPKEKPAGVRASFHFSEELDDALNESLYRVRKMVGKERKAAVSKDSIAEAILRRGLAELEAQGENSLLWGEIMRGLE